MFWQQDDSEAPVGQDADGGAFFVGQGDVVGRMQDDDEEVVVGQDDGGEAVVSRQDMMVRRVAGQGRMRW